MDNGERFADLPKDVQQAIAMVINSQPLPGGVPPDKRPGHLSPAGLTSRQREAVAGEDALHHPPEEDWPQT